MACKIHGASSENKRPALDGLFDTLQKKCKISELGEYVLLNTSVTSYVVNKVQKAEIAKFEVSNLNKLRSVAVYYDSGVMGKRKYQAVRLASSMMASNKKRGKTAIKYLSSCVVPKLLTYNNLMKEINSIDIGKVYCVNDVFNSSFDGEDKINGCFRDLEEYLPRLAYFYLKSNSRKENLKWFGETEGTFKIAFGGDGCPFGKHETACSFLVSFLNVGKKVASSSDNFLVFGANCEETSPVVKKYLQAFCKQMASVSGKVYEINGIHVTFHIEELPNDMKMLAMLGGELSNAARYFSSFANVSLAEAGDLNGKFGTGKDCVWKPWCYDDRISVAKKVADFKSKLEPTLAESTKRNKTTDFIAKQKSRTEFPPIIGSMIDKAHVEPLHLKNNAWQYFLKAVIKEALGKSKYPPSLKAFDDLPLDSCFVRIVNALRYEVKLKRFARKVRTWYDETQGKKGDLQHRLTGKDSRLLCHNFMRLIKHLSKEEDSQKQKQTVLALAYIGLRLRECCSIFNRLDVEPKDLDRLEEVARQYLYANRLFLPYTVNPTMWTLGHVLPTHARQVYETYQQGLLTVTMEGREAKHIALHRLSLNSSHNKRWQDIFRHEFIMLIWLQEQGHDNINHRESKAVYIPERCVNDDSYCYCGLEKADPTDKNCCFCGDELMSLIHESVKDRKYKKGLSI